MLSHLRNRFGIPGVIAVIALVFAMFGGAYAATNSGSGKATASAKAKPGPRGPRGKTGPAGPAGPAGPQGPAGANGAKGDAGAKGDKGEKGDSGNAGSAGAPGKSVTVTPISTGILACEERGGAEVKVEGAGSGTKVCNGEKGPGGPQGEEGKPWTPNNNLPPGATETGTWSLNGTAADTDGVYASIGFPIKLSAAIERELGAFHAHFQTDPDFETFCGEEVGGPNLPGAAPGEMCVYQVEAKNATFSAMTKIVKDGSEGEGATRVGSLLLFNMSGAGYAFGSWAVTGCSEEPGPFQCPA